MTKQTAIVVIGSLRVNCSDNALCLNFVLDGYWNKWNGHIISRLLKFTFIIRKNYIFVDFIDL